MPHDVVRASDHERDRSLGWLAVEWMEFFTRHGPGDVQGEMVRHPDEYAAFIVDCYALDGVGRMLYDSGFLSRPKGCDKSGMGARFALFEAFGPCRFAGWAKGGEVFTDPWGLGFTYTYRAGDPMGKPVKVPFIRCMATEEGQTGLVYDTIYLNLTDEDYPLSQVPGVDAGLTRTLLPGGGEITPSTASSSSKDGGRETFVVFDESHLYNTNELRRMYGTVTRNLRKRKRTAGTWFLETTTMFAAGEQSIAEKTYELAGLILEGKTRRQRLLFDHRYGECDDLSNELLLRAGLTESFGDCLAWNDLDGLVDEFYDPRSEVPDSRRYFLNVANDVSDAWVTGAEWAGCLPAEMQIIADREIITMGFDGSRKRSRGVTDATALIGCRVSDGHLFEVRVWEQPEIAGSEEWQIPVAEVESAVDMAFTRYRVVGFYADPAKWETYVAAWEAKYHAQLKVKATREHPIQWWMTGGRAHQIVRALDQFHEALIGQEMTHDGSFALTRHVLNARRRVSRSGIQIAKEHPDSPRKIDAAVAAVLAWQARVEAIAAGVLDEPETFVPRRIH